MYGFEREIVIGLAIFCLYQSIKYIFLKIRMTTKRNLALLGGGIFALVLFVCLSQFCLRKYIVLWDDNPFLAEFSFVWSLTSTAYTFLFLAVIIFILLVIWDLIFHQRNLLSRDGFQILTIAIVGFSVIFNLFENRYSFKPIVIFTQEMTYYLWFLILVVGSISVAVSWQRSWLDFLNRKEKYLAFFMSLVLFSILIGWQSSKVVLIHFFVSRLRLRKLSRNPNK